MSDVCKRCGGTGSYRRIIFATYSAGHSAEDAPCPDCCIVVKKDSLRALASQMGSFVGGGMHTSPMYVDTWCDQLRVLLGEKVDTTYVAKGKLDAIVDIHDNAVHATEFNQKLRKLLGVKELDSALDAVAALINTQGAADRIAAALRVVTKRHVNEVTSEAVALGSEVKDEAWMEAMDAVDAYHARRGDVSRPPSTCAHARLDRERMAPDGTWVVQCLDCGAAKEIRAGNADPLIQIVMGAMPPAPKECQGCGGSRTIPFICRDPECDDTCDQTDPPCPRCGGSGEEPRNQ